MRIVSPTLIRRRQDFESETALKVLVAYASKTGFTKGIAEFIGEKLRLRGLEVDVLDVDAVKDVRSYDAFVIGSAVYMFHWVKGAKRLVKKNRDVLAAKPTWLFSSGPVGKKITDDQGRSLLEVSAPKELDELKDLVSFKGHRVFYGGLDGSRLTGMVSLGYKMAMRSKAARESMPEGDFRDWKAIEAWATEIAESLTRGPLISG